MGMVTDVGMVTVTGIVTVVSTVLGMVVVVVVVAGLWIDASTICFQPFDEWFYGPLLSNECPEDIAAPWPRQIHRLIHLD